MPIPSFERDTTGQEEKTFQQIVATFPFLYCHSLSAQLVGHAAIKFCCLGLVYSNKDVEIFLRLREYILKLQFSPSLSL